MIRALFCDILSIPCFAGKCKCPEQFVIPSVTVSLYPLQLCEYAGHVIDRLLRATELLVDLTVFGIRPEMTPVRLIEQCAEQIALVVLDMTGLLPIVNVNNAQYSLS